MTERNIQCPVCGRGLESNHEECAEITRSALAASRAVAALAKEPVQPAPISQQLRRRVSARAMAATTDTSDEARAEAKARALEAIEQIVAIGREPMRNSQAAITAWCKILEIAGVGVSHDVALERFVKVAKEVLDPVSAARLLRRLAGVASEGSRLQ